MNLAWSVDMSLPSTCMQIKLLQELYAINSRCCHGIKWRWKSENGAGQCQAPLPMCELICKLIKIHGCGVTCRELISFLSPNLVIPLVMGTKVHVWNPAPLTEYHKRHARVVGTCMYHRPCFFNCNIGRQSWKADDMYTTPYVGFGVQPKMTILENR